MLGVVVPAHQEEASIGACLESIRVAGGDPRLGGEAVVVVVALDACSDGTREVALAHGAVVVTLACRNVGMARALGAKRALDLGAHWLAFTDADSRVAPDWLSAQLGQRADAVCGTIQVLDWGTYDERLQRQHEATYVDADGHRHIHGANLGMTAAAYRVAGGFQPLVSSEDVALVKALSDSGASIAWSAAPRVVTSARRHYRAPGGFGEALARVEQRLGTRSAP